MRFRLATWNINSVRIRLDLVERSPARISRTFSVSRKSNALMDCSPSCRSARSASTISPSQGRRAITASPSSPAFPSPRYSAAIFAGAVTRSISVTLDGGASQAKPLTLHNIYVPAGGDLPDPSLNPKFRHKLDFLEAMEAWFAGLRGKPSNRMILVGDLNVAPLETDVWSHKQLLKVVSHTPAEVERFLRVQAAHDFIDVMRRHVPAEEKLYTWWSYRNRDWRASNRGRRLDHIWTTPALDGAATSMRVLDEARDWPRTSDHVPVIADFEISQSPHPARR